MTSVLTGPDANIYAATTIPGTSAVAMTEFQALGNSVILIVTTAAGAGCASLTFTAECKYKIAGTDTAYTNYIDRDSAWSMVVTTPNVAGVYAFPMEGLDLAPMTYCRLSYTAATAAGNVKVDMLNWDNPKGGGAEVSVGDVVVDIDAIAVDMAALEVLLADIPNVIGTDNTAGPTKTLSIAGTAADGKIHEILIGTGVMATSSPVTIATDDTQFGAVGAAADPDGNVHGQLRSIAEGVVAGAAVTDDPQTGTGAIAYTTTVTTAFALSSIMLHLSAAGTTTEDFTIDTDANAGATYDTNLLTLDLEVDSVVDLVLTPEQDGLPKHYVAGDELAFAWPNTEARTWTLRVITKGV